MTKERILRILLPSLLLSFSLGCSFLFSGPSSAVRSFYGNLENGEIEKATNQVASQIKNTWGPKLKVALSEATNRIKSRGGISSIQIDKEEATGEVGNVSGFLIFKDGSKEAFQYQMTKENGEWKIVIK